MPGDVDHLAIRAADEEPANSPRFVGKRVHNLVTTSLCLLVRGLYVVDLDRHNRVLWCRRVPGHDLDGSARFRGGEPGHPALVHAVLREAKEPVELPRTFDLDGAQVGDDL